MSDSEEPTVIVSLKTLQQALGGREGICEQFYECAKTGNVAGLNLLLTAGADIEDWEGDLHYQGALTPLIAAVAYGQPEAVEFLTQHGANLNNTDGNGKTALDWTKIEFLGEPRRLGRQRKACAKILKTVLSTSSIAPSRPAF